MTANEQPTDRVAAALLKAESPVSASDIARATGLKTNTCRARLNEMARRGLAAKDETGTPAVYSALNDLKTQEATMPDQKTEPAEAPVDMKDVLARLEAVESAIPAAQDQPEHASHEHDSGKCEGCLSVVKNARTQISNELEQAAIWAGLDEDADRLGEAYQRWHQAGRPSEPESVLTSITREEKMPA